MRRLSLSIALILATATASAAQEFKVDFGGSPSDLNAPIEVTANALSVDQETGKAVFDGDVQITQGDMQLMAGLVSVLYSDDSSGIKTLFASGGVNITSGKDVAKSETAEYDVETGVIRMAGNVELIQSGNTITAGKMDVNLTDNTAALHGRVRTVLQPRGN